MERRRVEERDHGRKLTGLLKIVGSARAGVRLTTNHYLVRWRPDSTLWCIINMTALDQHAVDCPTLRSQFFCEHLRIIGELCACESGGDYPIGSDGAADE